MAWIVRMAWVFRVYKTAFRLRDASAEGEKSVTVLQRIYIYTFHSYLY